MTKHKDIKRRDFVKGLSAVAGGLALGAKGLQAGAAPQPPLSRWSSPWRPDSPRRLSERTHQLAKLGLSGTHGRNLKNAGFSLPSGLVRTLSPEKVYGHAALLVAEKAPLRILPGEKVVGSATLRQAAYHQTPVAGVPSTSHTTLGFHKALRLGYREYRKKIQDRLKRGFKQEKQDPMTPVTGEEGVLLCSSFGNRWLEGDSLPEFDRPPLTVECKARLHSSAHFNVMIMNRLKSSALHWELYSYMQSGFFSAYLPGLSPSEVVSDRCITDGRWHDLAMVYTQGRVRLYVDGELVKDQKVQHTGKGDKSKGEFFIGGHAPSGLPCKGEIEHIRMSRGAHMPGKMPAKDCIGHWTFSKEKKPGVFSDLTMKGNDLFLLPARATQPQVELLESMLLCLDAAQLWHQRYMNELKRLAGQSTGEERKNYLEVMENLRHVPENPPANFRQAVQSLWFMYAFQRLMGTWSGVGRIDEMLGTYLERDLKRGDITLDEARELLAHFWIKGTEWIGACGDARGSGDAQHYQNIILSGVNAKGEDITNDVTCLVLDVVEELNISDFPIAVRVNRRTPRRLLERIAEVQKHGGGIVALYNEEVVIDGLVKFGYQLEEARTFTNDGCWEVLIPGRTAFSYYPFDALQMLQDALGIKSPESPAPDYSSFDNLYAAFLEKLQAHIDHHHLYADTAWKNGHPTPLVSIFVEDCIERGRGYLNRGARHSVLAPHAGGLANVANSLLVIKKLVYDEKYLSLQEFQEILRGNWESQEYLRQLILNRTEAYGNDETGADAMMEKVFEDYTSMVAQVPRREGVLRPCGISTFGREIGWRGPQGGRTASPDGHRAEEILATNFSPSPGTDTRGPGAVLKSYCKMDFTRTPNGATVELKMHPETVKADRGTNALVALMKSFVRMGGFFMHVDVVDTALLIDAQRHPEKYPHLSVRIAGWSARFATLNEQWQNMVIQRTQQRI